MNQTIAPLPQKICLIGGSGFIGRHLAARLAGDGHRITVASRKTALPEFLVLPSARLVNADIHDPAQLEALIAGHDAVVSMVGILHGSRAQFEKNHARLPEAIVEACRRQRVPRLVHVSALGAAQDAPSDYLQTKALGELAVEGSGLDWTILRPSVVFGRDDAFLNLFAALQKRLPLLPLAGAASKMAPVWVEDVARAVCASLGRPQTLRRKLDLAGPEIYTLAELARLAGRCSGHSRPVIGLPDSLAMLQAGLMERLPGPTLMSRDNVRSLRWDNISEHPFPSGPLGFAPTPLSALAPAWLSGRDGNHIVSRYREKAAR
ncbi:complex I NDUFA9 subunit family protein [Chromobacterium subtsugae]|uniref:Complex I NDUFA9 subunit family protein n=1 Tax=Chromobacterium subtsugae TaxID=251747 RepID=A0ABS7FCT6_9NEIS|nr:MULTISPECIES: complex I NDUFA9 subunit family protein [Chromobacterium]KUM05529.1 NAD-dependent dehydratase [Chromobacterium subtsugae]KZE88245.1 NAD-dependent dehydratase [Chromobacterium sp. F49]MBW7565574.1 complex I NDUFA9 subunit family protein [Chromobacterium subtsugae]MBW8287903.1 complex I NDUFA9 subunit family protein [Chromobacterium subtsugae]WSE89670.1 complex I NDUFA9 subunit family protein [Chromobacterium subtsugae]